GPTGLETIYDYDPYGMLGQVTTAAGDGDNRITSYAYDAMHRVTQVTPPSGGGCASTLAYDVLGHVTSSTDGIGTTTSAGYDFQGSLTQSTDPAGSATYTYTSYGDVSTVSDGVGASA